MRSIGLARAASLALVVVVFARPLFAQDRALDRRRYVDTAVTRTSDDPRRTPIPPERGGAPKAVLVVRGGRIVDGTGAAAREATLVITGNRITNVLPPGSTEWPR